MEKNLKIDEKHENNYGDVQCEWRKKKEDHVRKKKNLSIFVLKEKERRKNIKIQMQKKNKMKSKHKLKERNGLLRSRFESKKAIIKWNLDEFHTENFCQWKEKYWHMISERDRCMISILERTHTDQYPKRQRIRRQIPQEYLVEKLMTIYWTYVNELRIPLNIRNIFSVSESEFEQSFGRSRGFTYSSWQRKWFRLISYNTLQRFADWEFVIWTYDVKFFHYAISKYIISVNHFDDRRWSSIHESSCFSDEWMDW